MKKQLLLASLVATLALPAAAEGLYAVGDISQATIEVSSYEDTSNGFSIGAGYNIDSTFSVEASYRDLGDLGVSYDGSGFGVDFSAIQVSAIGKLPVNEQLDVYGRLGFAKITVDFAAYEDGEKEFSASESKNKAVVGIGARYAVNDRTGLRFEWNKFSKFEVFTLSSIALGLDYSFQ